MASAAHFPDGLPELLAAVAISGFEELLAVLVAPLADSRPPKGLQEILRRYVRFGLEHPNLYRAMFSSRLADKLGAVAVGETAASRGTATYLTLLQVKAATLNVFDEQMRILREKGILRAHRTEDAAKAAAALAHGMVGEFIDEGIGLGTAPVASLTATRLAVADTMAEALFYGLLRSPATRGTT